MRTWGNKLRSSEVQKFIYATRNTHRISRFTFHVIWHTLFVLLACGTPPLVVPEPSTMATNFTLKDQYDTEFQLRRFHGENMLLLGCDKNSLGQGKTWFDLFLERYADSLRIFPIVNGSGFPFFVRLFLKGKIKSELRGDEGKSNPPSILLDWDGKVSRQYGMRSQRCTVVLIDRFGRIRLIQPLGRITEEEIREIFDLMDQQMRQ